MRKSFMIALCIILMFILGCRTVYPAAGGINTGENIDSLKEQLEEQIRVNDILKNDNKKLTEDKLKLQKDIDGLRDSIAKFPSTYITENNYNKRLVERDVKLRYMPTDKSEITRIIEAYTLLDVRAKAIVYTEDGQEIWLMAVVPAFDTPYYNFGWIRESDTVAYTKENTEKVRAPITLKEGCISLEKDVVLIYGTKGTYGISKIEGGVATIYGEGGWNTTIDKKYIIYPEVE